MRKPRLSNLDGRGRQQQRRQHRRSKKSCNPWSTGTLLRFEPLENRRLLHGGDLEPPADALDDHIHYALTILIDGESTPLPANIGVTTTALISPIHTHDVDGRIHDEPINGVIPTEFHTVGDFFDAWRTLGGLAGNNPNANFSETQLMATTIDATHEVRMYVNGERNFRFDAYIPHDEDDIVLTRSEKSAPASVVLTRFETTQGTLDVELLRDAAPESVQNFLKYITDGDYVNSILHRSLPGFITQFGGFNVDLTGGYDRVATNAPVVNEPNISNTERTIAYAKLGPPPGQPPNFESINSATSQWFVNLGDNASNLDAQNGGFTVFGRVINDTYDVAVAQSLIPTYNATNVDPFGVGSAFTDLPIVDFPGGPINSTNDVDQNDLVVVTSASVVPTAMITGVKFNDLNANGIREAGEQGLAGWTIYIDDNGNEQLDAGERSTVTEDDGHYRFSELPAGNYEVREVFQNGWTQTAPGSGFHLVSLDSGDAAVDVDFGNFADNPPAGVDLLPAFDTGSSSSDNLTNLTQLTFRVSGVVDGSVVILYMDGEVIGAADGLASGGSVDVATLEPSLLTDGPHTFHATQLVGASESAPSPSLVVTIDTVVAPFNSLAIASAVVGESYFYGASNAGENTALSYALVDGPAGMTINSSLGQVNWTPGENQIGPRTFEVRATDRAGNTLNQVSHITVFGNLPVLPDNYDVDEDNTLDINAAAGVLANDGDQASGTLTATLLSTTTHGTLALGSNGSFTYVPNDNFFGTDSFTYEAADGVRSSPVATATITVAPMDDPTIAVPDSYNIDEDTPRTVDASGGVLANDEEVDGDPLSVKLVETTSHGQLSLADDGSFTYTPGANFHGSDSFRYRIDDGQGLSNTATVSFTVRSINDAPVADNESYAVDEDAVLSVSAGEGVLVGDSDVENDPLSAVIAQRPDHGTVDLNADGSFTYTPDENFHGQDRFSYRASDGQDESNLAEVTIDVAPVNDPTVAADDLFTLNEDQTLHRDAVDGVLANDFEVDGDPLEVILLDGPTHGALTLGSDGSLSYVPDANFHGDDSFTYKVNDGTSDSNVAKAELRVTSVNDPPLADDEGYAVDEDTTLVVDASEGVLIGDTDFEGSDLTAVLVDPPQHGSVQLADDGSFTYTPEENFAGQDSFSYRADDGQDASNLAQVMITVNPIDDPPVAVTDVFSVNEDETLNPAAVDGVLANDVEVDGDPLTATLVEGPTNGQLTFNDDGSFVYVPNENFNGGDQFSYRTSDGMTDSSVVQALIFVEPVNDAPVATPDDYSVDEDTPLIVDAAGGLLRNDSDIDSLALGATLVDGPSHGSVDLADDGSLRYVPDADFNGTDTFIYRADDGTDASSPVEVTLTVNAIDDPPRIDPVADRTIFSGIEFRLTVTASDPDHSGAGIEFSLADDAPDGATIDPTSGRLVWTPSEEDAGEVTLNIRATNTATGLSSSIAVDVQVFPASALQALEEANSSRRTSRRALTSVRRVARGSAVLRRISRGPSSSLSLGSLGRPSGIATGQIGVNTGLPDLSESTDRTKKKDDAKKETDRSDEPKRDRRRRRPEDTSETNEQSSDTARRAHDEAVGQIQIDKSSLCAESLQELASNKIEARLREWSEAGALRPAPIDVAADAGTSDVPRLLKKDLASDSPDAAPAQAEESAESSVKLPLGTIVAATAAAGAIPLLVTGIKRARRWPIHSVLSESVRRRRD